MTIEYIDIRPTIGLLALMKNIKYTEWEAISEFIDNSVQSYRSNKKKLKKLDRNYKLKIKIELLPNEIIIKDNAAGISEDRYEDAFETGKPPPDTGGLSEFGVGMKIAACWFADKWKVHTKALGEKNWRLVQFDIEKLRENNTERLEVNESRAGENTHYTIVTLSKLNHRPKTASIKKIFEHLSSIYRFLINSDEIDILINGIKLKYEAPKIRVSGYYKDWLDGIIKNPKKIKWYKKINFNFEGLTDVIGYAGIRETGRVAQPGFSLFRRGRLITGTEAVPFKPSQIFGLGNDRRQQVIFGELRLDDMPVTFQKNDFKWDDTLKSKFINDLKNNIEFYDDKEKISFIDQAKEWTEKLERDDIRKQTKESLPKISNIIARGLENSKATKFNVKTDEKKHKRAELSEESEWQEVSLENQKYKYKIITEYDENNPDLYFAEFPESKNNFKIKVFINLKHKFAARFFTHNNDREGFLTLITFFAICEAQVRNIDGSKDAALIRLRLNSICENIPPRT